MVPVWILGCGGVAAGNSDVARTLNYPAITGLAPARALPVETMDG